MSASERIKKAIADKKSEVDKYGWKQPSPEWQRAFGYMAGLHMALDLLYRAEDVPSPLPPAEREGGPSNG